METVTHSSWGSFEEYIFHKSKGRYSSDTLYRGQSQSKWELKTTLERKGCKNYPVSQYELDISSAARKVETVTGKRWPLKEQTAAEIQFERAPNNYEFMAYLRHNGFPSPLLDWTRSPYVAAFFAFHKADSKESEHIAVFEYVEMPTGGKGYSDGEATICGLGPWIATDRRHFLQQSEYTVCRCRAVIGNSLYYTNHEEAFARNDEDQDICKKHLVPASDRAIALQRLKLMNVTPYSLFETTESLMDVLSDELFTPLSKD